MLTQMDVFHHPVTTELIFLPTLSVSTSGTTQARGRQVTSSDQPSIQSLSLAPHNLRPPNHTFPGTPGEVLEGSSPQDEGEGESANGHNHSPGPLPLPREESETDQSDSEPKVMKPQSDRRGNCKNFVSSKPFSDKCAGCGDDENKRPPPFF